MTHSFSSRASHASFIIGLMKVCSFSLSESRQHDSRVIFWVSCQFIRSTSTFPIQSFFIYRAETTLDGSVSFYRAGREKEGMIKRLPVQTTCLLLPSLLKRVSFSPSRYSFIPTSLDTAPLAFILVAADVGDVWCVTLFFLSWFGEIFITTISSLSPSLGSVHPLPQKYPPISTNFQISSLGLLNPFTFCIYLHPFVNFLFHRLSYKHSILFRMYDPWLICGFVSARIYLDALIISFLHYK